MIANGRCDDVLDRILAGEEIGTLILAEGRSIDSRRRWIAWSASANGKLTLDAGAAKAIQANGRSLLAVGVSAVFGNFAKGDVVSLCDVAGKEIARGLINYSVEEMRAIAGQPTERIAEVLGHCPYKEVVHRNNLVPL